MNNRHRQIKRAALQNTMRELMRVEIRFEGADFVQAAERLLRAIGPVSESAANRLMELAKVLGGQDHGSQAD